MMGILGANQKPSLPTLKIPNYFVYIIESPSATDLFSKQYEAEMLSWGLTLNSIKHVHRIVVDRENFIKAIDDDFISQVKSHADCVPIIHISAHGDYHGIGLTSTDVVKWGALQDLLINVSSKLGYCVFLLCMSSCNGFAAMVTAIQAKLQPFYAVIGPDGEPNWSDTAVGYVAFYHLLKKGFSPSDAVDGMNVASGFSKFIYLQAKEVNMAFDQWVAAEMAKIMAKKTGENAGEKPAQC